MVFANKAHAEGNFFQTGDFQALALFQGFDKAAGFVQGIEGSGVQPGEAPAQQFDAQVAAFQVGLIDAGDFQLSPVAGFYLFGDVNYIVVVEVEAGYGVIGFRVGRLFFDGDGSVVVIKLHYAEALRVGYLVAEYGGALFPLGGGLQHVAQALAVVDVVAEYQAYAVIADEIFADDEGLGEAVRAGLFCVVEVNAPLAAVAEQALEALLVFGGGDDEDIPDARQHEYGERVVDHGFVVYREELFGYASGDWVEAGAGAAGEDYSFHLELLEFGAEGSVLVGADPVVTFLPRNPLKNTK